MGPSRYYILTKIEAGERREVFEHKQKMFRKYAPYFVLVTIICWILFAMTTLDIIFDDKTGEGFALIGIYTPLYYILMKRADTELWKPPTTEEMNELGDELI